VSGAHPPRQHRRARPPALWSSKRTSRTARVPKKPSPAVTKHGTSSPPQLGLVEAHVGGAAEQQRHVAPPYRPARASPSTPRTPLPSTIARTRRAIRLPPLGAARRPSPRPATTGVRRGRRRRVVAPRGQRAVAHLVVRSVVCRRTPEPAAPGHVDVGRRHEAPNVAFTSRAAAERLRSFSCRAGLRSRRARAVVLGRRA
jgi:hypothetical protein